MTSSVSDRGARTGSRAQGSATAVIERDHRASALDDELDSELDIDAYDRDDQYGADDQYDAGYDADAGYDRYDRDDDEYDEYGVVDVVDEDDDRDDDRAGTAPRSYRPGRGGFDPDAAAEAAQTRYAFRQRVALGLIAVAVLSGLAALVVSSALWWLHVVTDIALVGYLVFLRRQTRLEEDLRERRAARLSGERRAIEARRERQAEHEARMAAVRREEAEWHHDERDADLDADLDGDAEDEYEYADDEGYDLDEAPRWAAPRTPAPSVPDGMELVDDSSDDPAFHRLDGRESVPSYRRAAGA